MPDPRRTTQSQTAPDALQAVVWNSLELNALRQPLSPSELLRLQRWNTPTIYNGWEQITTHNASADAFNIEEVHDFMPQMGPMVGWAVTVVIEPSNGDHLAMAGENWAAYRRYVASLPGPKIVVVQDLDKPRTVGAFWGEVNSNIHRAIGCVGTIIDGGIRDLDEMNNAGFKALARRMCVAHAFSMPLRWNCTVEVFGRQVQPGQLIHADKHGFLAVPFGDEKGLLEAATFMDANECNTLIPAARQTAGLSAEDILKNVDAGAAAFRRATENRFKRKGEWA